MRTIEYIKNRSSENDNGCWVWQGSTKASGYGQLKYKGKILRAHRHAWELTHGCIPAGLHVCHVCDVRNCVNPAHLFLGTNQDNVDDRQNKNRNKPRYGQRGTEGIPWADVQKIRSLKGVNSASELAEMFNLHRVTVYRIWKGERRLHI